MVQDDHNSNIGIYISVYEKFGEQWPINNQKFNNDNSYNKETFKLYKSYLH